MKWTYEFGEAPSAWASPDCSILHNGVTTRADGYLRCLEDVQMKMSILLCASVIAIVTSGNAVADFSQYVGWYGVGDFDLIAVKITTSPSGASFKHTTFVNLQPDTWATVYENDALHPTIATATGTAALSTLYFDLQFAGDLVNGLAYDAVVMLGENTVWREWEGWNGSGWSYGRYYNDSEGWNPTRSELVSAAVPVPAAVILGFLGLGCAGMKLRRYV
jgi:hypothetical protein